MILFGISLRIKIVTFTSHSLSQYQNKSFQNLSLSIEIENMVSSHMFLRQNLTIKSHDGGKGGHFCYHNGISNHLPLTRGVQPPGQLSLYLLNDLSSLCSEFTKGIIALPVWHLESMANN